MINSNNTIKYQHFPVPFQTVIWRNWGLVSVNKIAEVLNTSIEIIEKSAHQLGLPSDITVDPKWASNGYFTIIKRNWHLLNEDQILNIIGWTKKQLDFAMIYGDFMWVKLGKINPNKDGTFYRPLNSEEIFETKKIRELVKNNFDFIKDVPSDPAFGFIENLKSFECNKSNDLEIIQKLFAGFKIYSSSYDFYIADYISDFINRFHRRYNLQLGISESFSADKQINIEINNKFNLSRENHIIYKNEKSIDIKASEPEGILRALQYIEDTIQKGDYEFSGNKIIERKTVFDTRMIFSYFADSWMIDEENEMYPDALLEKYSSLGINAIWIQGILYEIYKCKFCPELSSGLDKKIENINNLVKKAKRYGIDVFLYINEPRGLPIEFFQENQDLKGSVEDNYGSLCTSIDEVKEMLYDGIRSVFTNIPSLAGLFVISMSENLTNCYSRSFGKEIKCPRCSKRAIEDVVSEVNNIINKAAKSVRSDARVIVWTWGWPEKWRKSAIELLSKDIEIMCTSEEDLPVEFGDGKTNVLDYTMSIPGPSELSINTWDIAKTYKMKTVAKIQVNNTWECSVVPYLPVNYIIEKHISNLKRENINGLLLSWNLGGYPSINLELCKTFYWDDSSKSGDNIMKSFITEKYGVSVTEKVEEALKLFSCAMSNFPFHLDTVYYAPQNVGPMNLLFDEPTNYTASMVGYPYDDLKSWRAVYSEEVFRDQFKKLSEMWGAGIEILDHGRKFVEKNKYDKYEDLVTVSKASFCHFRSTYLQIEFIILRKKFSENRSLENKFNLIKILHEEIEIAKMLYKIVLKDSRIGFEPSNQYNYTRFDLVEKVINCHYLLDVYNKAYLYN